MNRVDTKWQDVAEALRGQCTSDIEDTLEAHGLSVTLASDDSFLAFIDATVFCCTQCSWWCPIEEEVSDEHGLDDWTCEECATEE